MIEVSHLTKRYGNFTAVDDLSFEIGEGQVYGFLGPNGAGKSTTMNIMTGCLSPSSGTVKIGGYDILEQPEAAKRLIGYLPELPPLYMNETPEEYLQFVGEAKGLRGAALREQIEKAIESTRIESVRGKVIAALSKGYRQRVGIAQALLGSPRVIILDEPTVGLDPHQIIEIRELIRDLGREHTVILSSHILSEVQAICEQVLIIAKGKLVAFDTPDNLEKMLGAQSVAFRVQADKATAQAILESSDGVSDWTIETAEDGALLVRAQLADGSDAQTVCGALTLAFAAKGLPVFEMQRHRANLEDVFLELTETDTAAVPAEGETEAAAPETDKPAIEAAAEPEKPEDAEPAEPEKTEEEGSK